MSGPLLLLAIPLLAAAIISIGLRRFPVAAALTAAGAVLLLLLLLVAIPDAGETGLLALSGAPFAFLGRSLAVTDAARETLRLLYGGATLLFLLAALMGDHPDFSSAGVAALAPLAFALMAQPFLFGVVALFVAAGMMAVLIQGGRAGSTLASLRFLLMAALATAALLVVGWMLESEQAVLASGAWRLLLLSIILLLGSFPFHIWLRPVAAEASPLAVTYILGLLPLVLVAFIGPVLGDPILLRQADAFAVALRWAAVAAALVAAFLVATSRRSDALLAYLVLGDTAAVLMALSLGQPGLSAALFALMLRFFSLLLCALGLHLMSTPGRDESRRSWAVILFAYGAFSLAGVPLTPGFAGRWVILDMAGAVSAWLAAALLLFAVAGVAGLLRWLITWFDANAQAGFLGRSRLVTILVALILLGAILVALRPGPLLNAATSLAALF